MFIGNGGRRAQAPEERHLTHVAPELGKILRNGFYKHSAPLALRNSGSRQQYRSGARCHT
jgi:hypothetical protein